ncbi:hypothetical protein EB008_02690 [bacterium]|nr:hypothetical protein [bacterium]
MEIANIFMAKKKWFGGRFGDNLLSYLHAKWISYKYNMLLLYKPFPYSDELALSELETKINDYYYDHEINIFKRKMVCDSNLRYFRPSDLLKKNPSGSILYVVPYFPEGGCKRTWFFNGSKKWSYFDVDWKDQIFRSIALEMLRPIKFFKLCDFDCLIRPDSNFSRVPSLLKEYKVLIYPSDLEKLGDRNYIISKIDVVRNE